MQYMERAAEGFGHTFPDDGTEVALFRVASDAKRQSGIDR
jgi:hypothetical protein